MGMDGILAEGLATTRRTRSSTGHVPTEWPRLDHTLPFATLHLDQHGTKRP